MHQEKKYRVESFAEVEKILDRLGAKKQKQSFTFHYYTDQNDKDVVKLVKYENGDEIHILKEADGKYALVDRIKVRDTAAGLDWLKLKGLKVTVPIKMANTNYRYKDGIVGLYIINDKLNSVILDFPENMHETIAKELHLETAEVISLPYNQYLAVT